MFEILFQYHRVDALAWAYLSSFLIVGLFFKFSRVWSVRNLDLILLILLAPGLTLIHYGRESLRAVQERFKNSVSPTDSEQTNRASQNDTSSADSSDADSSAISTSDETLNKERDALSSGVDTPIEEIASPGSIYLIGYRWIIIVSFLWLLRLLLDPTMVRRPLLEPNLTTGGLNFIGISLFVVLIANIITSTPSEEDMKSALAAKDLLKQNSHETYRRHGPGYYLLNMLPTIPTMPFATTGDIDRSKDSLQTTAKTMAILSQIAVVAGMITVGAWHFGSPRAGFGATALYLMLPYTSQMTGRVDHVLPAALLLWAIVLYRQPFWSGLLMGLAMGTSYYALYLLPLWLSFYWPRGSVRFGTGVVTTLGVLVLLLAITPDDRVSFWQKVRQMFGLWEMSMANLDGIWNQLNGFSPYFRAPVLAAFVILSFGFIWWPAQKNLGTLLSCSAAVMVATQFWHGYGGGTYIGWYLPLALLTVFRPNLEDRVALTVITEAWFPKSRPLRRAA